MSQFVIPAGIQNNLILDNTPGFRVSLSIIRLAWNVGFVELLHSLWRAELLY
jgi:hypothetical protein